MGRKGHPERRFLTLSNLFHEKEKYNWPELY